MRGSGNTCDGRCGDRVVQCHSSHTIVSCDVRKFCGFGTTVPDSMGVKGVGSGRVEILRRESTGPTLIA